MTGSVIATELPADVGSAIRAVKAQLRAQIGDVPAVLAEAEGAMRREVASVVTAREAGQQIWPVTIIPVNRSAA
ncbi:MAG TPA: hypothetical protein VK594_21090 [Streptosporangiaceae bacterium]|jgi:hypothetical protein|nr:hypothetical protein [Streptosporangiaceae bacterium]